MHTYPASRSGFPAGGSVPGNGVHVTFAVPVRKRVKHV